MSFEYKQYIKALNDIKIKNYHIVQIGCGVVGGAYVDAYKKLGNKVTGIEASRKLIQKYKGEFPIYHISDDLSEVKQVDFIMISVCTPLKENRLDMSYLFSTVPNVRALLKNSPDATVIIRSTVQPTTVQEYKDLLETRVEVVFQPEFLRAVSAKEDALHPWYIVLGVPKDTNPTKLIDLYSKFVVKEKIKILSIEEAIMLKIYHNCFNACKISFFNQAGLLCQAINKKHDTQIDIHKITETLVETCEGLRNPKYGTKSGHAYYGTCLPKDSAELASLEQLYNLESGLFTNVVNVNNEIMKTDKEEILNGDHHMTYNKF